jgi:Ser/Thr protein kinase RdoA (MazF antagonist)
MQATIHLLGESYDYTVNASPSSKLRAKIAAILPSGISHFDYDRSNVLANEDGLTCVLDFEGMRYDALIFCLWFTMTRIFDEERDIDKVKMYLMSYQDIRPLTFMERMMIIAGMSLRFRKLHMIRLFRNA